MKNNTWNVLDADRHQRYQESGFSKTEWEKIIAEMDAELESGQPTWTRK
jgi:hypothetical protein